MTQTLAKKMAELAAEAASQFHRTKKAGPTPGLPNGVWVRDQSLRTDDWIHRLCRDAHRDMFPDDWRHEFIIDALHDIAAPSGDFEDEAAAREHWNDQLVERFDERYTRTFQQTGWLHSHSTRLGYVDDWRAEFGSDSEVWRDISGGMWTEYQEVFWSVFDSVLNRAKQISDGAGT